MGKYKPMPKKYYSKDDKLSARVVFSFDRDGKVKVDWLRTWSGGIEYYIKGREIVTRNGKKVKLSQGYVKDFSWNEIQIKVTYAYRVGKPKTETYKSIKGAKGNKFKFKESGKFSFKVDFNKCYPRAKKKKFKKRKLKSITVKFTAFPKVRGGVGNYTVSRTYDFSSPPRLTECVLKGTDDNSVLFRFSNGYGKYIYEDDVYKVKYKLRRVDVKTGDERYSKQGGAIVKDGNKLVSGTFLNPRNEGFEKSWILPGKLPSTPGASIVYKGTVTAYGFGGVWKSKKDSLVYTIATPGDPEINKIDLSANDNLSLEQNVFRYKQCSGSVRVYFSRTGGISSSSEESEKTYTLQRLVTPYDVNKSYEAAVMEGWEPELDTFITKSNSVSNEILSEPLSDALVAMGFNNNARVYDVRVWYRVKAVINDVAVYSEPKQCDNLAVRAPTAAKDYSGFMAIRNTDDDNERGSAIEGVVGWANKNVKDEGIDADAHPQWADAIWTTVVEWSEHKNAVESNEAPNTLEISWENNSTVHDNEYTNYASRVNNNQFGNKSSLKEWEKSANFTIYGLSPGIKYYLWTRRHMVLDDYEDYGPRSQAPDGYFPFVPTANPTQVQVYTEDRYSLGSDFTVSWEHDGAGDEKSKTNWKWNIYMVADRNQDVPGESMFSDMPKKCLDGGTGAKNMYKIPWSKLEPHIPTCEYADKKTFDTKRRFGIAVGVSTGGNEIYSCADTVGRFTGLNRVEVGYPPSGKLFFMPSSKTDKRNYAIRCSGGYPGTTMTLRFMVTFDSSNKTVDVTLVNVSCDEMRYMSAIAYKAEVLDIQSNLLFKREGVVNSKTTSFSGQKLSTTDTIGYGRKVNGTSVKVKLSITGGTYFDDGEVARTIPSDASEASTVKTVAAETGVVKTRTEEIVYLFAKRDDVSGQVTVFAKEDTTVLLPDGEHLQRANECVFLTDVSSGEFSKVESVFTDTEKKYFDSIITGDNKYPYVAKVNVYSHRRMYDGSRYVVKAFLKDSYNETLVSETYEVEFDHVVSRSAEPCGGGSRVEGTTRKLSRALENQYFSGPKTIDNATYPPSPSVEIFVDKPSNYETNDRYDVYRVTPDGSVKVAEDLQFDGRKIVDRYAPYSNDGILKYSIVTITEEGSFVWTDLPYSVNHAPGIRFDWGYSGNQMALELPLDTELSDSYTKDVKTESYIDGTVAVKSNKSVVRKGSNKAKIVRYDPADVHNDPMKFALIRDLARYPGPAFFRSDNGVAYECVVEVDGIDEKYNELTSQISFKLTEVTPPDDEFTITQDAGDTGSSLSSQSNSVVETISDKLLVEYVTSDGDVLEPLSTTSNKSYNDVVLLYSEDESDDECVYSFPCLTVDLKNAVNREISTGIIGSSYNAREVYLGAIVKDGNDVVSIGRWYFGSLSGLDYNMLAPTTEASLTIQKTDQVQMLEMETYVYLVKESQLTTNGDLLVDLPDASGENYVNVLYEVVSNPQGKNPDKVELRLTDVLFRSYSESVSVETAKIWITSGPFGANSSSTYRTYQYRLDHELSTTNTFSRKLGDSIWFNRKMQDDGDIYLTLTVDHGSTIYTGTSEKVTIGDFDSISDVHTSLTTPNTVQLTIPKR